MSNNLKSNSNSKSQVNIVKAWTFQDTLLEFYRYVPTQPEKLPAHCHDEYQFCLSPNYPSEYYYHKSVHFLPPWSLSVIHPGEMHSGTGRDVGNCKIPAAFLMMYVKPKIIQQFAQELDWHDRLPFFPNSIIVDYAIAGLFINFHQVSGGMASRLEQDEQLQCFLTELINHFASGKSVVKPFLDERKAVQQVRKYLHDYYAEDISLKQLAELVNFSPYYLSRVFKAEVGVSLPQYQTQVRINQAKSMLIEGMSIKQVAARTGFVDQSHFSRNFKRFVQVTPGNYLSKHRNKIQYFFD